MACAQQNDSASSAMLVNNISAIKQPEPKPFVRTASSTRPPSSDDPEAVCSLVSSWDNDPFDGLLEALLMIPTASERHNSTGCHESQNHVDNLLNEP